MILLYNVVYVYVCKIGEKQFGTRWRSFSWLDQSNPVVCLYLYMYLYL